MLAGADGYARQEGVAEMAKRHKRRIFAGAVCTQIVYNVNEQADIKSSKPRKPRFATQAERDEFNSKI